MTMNRILISAMDNASNLPAQSAERYLAAHSGACLKFLGVPGPCVRKVAQPRRRARATAGVWFGRAGKFAKTTRPRPCTMVQRGTPAHIRG
jgi:hypothetical protein